MSIWPRAEDTSTSVFSEPAGVSPRLDSGRRYRSLTDVRLQSLRGFALRLRLTTSRAFEPIAIARLVELKGIGCRFGIP